MSPRKRDRGTLSSSPQSHTDKRPRIKEDDTGKRSSQSEGEAPMDLASSSDSEPDTITTVRPFSNSLTHQRPAPAPESETSETDSTTASTTDDDSDDNDETEGDRDSEENTGVVSWGWGDAHFQYELDPVRAVGQDQEQDTPYSDPRIPLWQQEDRIFADDILKEYPEIASLVAVSESHGPLEIDGVPQLSLFCDGSMKDSNFEGWKMGGYSVAFRDPFFGTGDSVSQADPARFLAKQAVREHLQVSSFQQQEENESREGLAQVADFTILEYATQALSVGHVELGAISQCLEVGIMLQDEHQRDSMKIRVFTDSAAAVERLEFGILPLDSDEGSFFRWSTNPLVRTIVWQSHYLTSSLGRSRFCQTNLPANARDGILDKLHKWTEDVINWEPKEQPEKNPEEQGAED
ncbi:hypothetical protein SMACR_09096 [Sordaria macrospora]|uniref:WGS project CABT00000000 data, contig 2.72 n=2 Tax=Sordaria macrospora TaxID=5147 RepID=F7WB89_SORMK|nr:uncharacterized protein SMAC_09096 [Sordaria macrospora k-hell]KAA8628874.1 hypothetical protein SMACR_09096 [Sordaria macrospora]WPJ57242.1 hypothetical protein SMAC4_09096 [Sordaria macrospora]CCC14367.1 unnamed protein product [Sordaria macrospora k-hell]